ncbi:DnaB-like helicase C-terminal domain-containing protein, partial [[Eubacterium] siraeum]|nr:DnaB-like helicase C-terminal domain-containing protein [[Eubacterium] siraeum]
MKSGFPSLDKYLHGLNKSDLLIVAARPGMGKTSFAMNMATFVAIFI